MEVHIRILHVVGLSHHFLQPLILVSQPFVIALRELSLIFILNFIIGNQLTVTDLGSLFLFNGDYWHL